jgi:drug/metabolite transporter (DMT)-like permease
MTRQRFVLSTGGATSLFVLLWSSGPIFARVGLNHSSAFAFLVLRFAMAFVVLSILALVRRPRSLPAPGTRLRVAVAGSLLLGTYSICFLLALDNGITPGVLATVLGAQPILTLVFTERRFSFARLLGLCLALGGLTIVVYHSVVQAHFSVLGTAFALAALAGMTAGAILQKAIQQPPLAVMPLQYAVSLVLAVAFVPVQPFHFELSAGFVVPLLWIGIMISVVAQLLLYRLIRVGNLVNVTSLFYLVPIVVAIMDRIILGNPLSPMTILGMAAILAGLALAFRKSAHAQSQ